MQSLEVMIEDSRWKTVDLPALARTAVGSTLTRMQLDPDLCEVSVLGCDDAQIMTLNADFRAKRTATNVLSWPARTLGARLPGDRPRSPRPGPDGMIELGDIALSYTTCATEAVAANRPISAHATHLIIHGTLHLLGYDHIREADGDLMESIEVEILGKLGYDNPYCNDAATGAALTRRLD